MIDAASYFNDILDWQVNPKEPFSRGRILRVGNSSLVLIPEEDPSVILKIVLDGREVHGLRPRDEVRVLTQLQDLEDEQFGLPRVLAWGENPEHIVMTNMGPVFGKGRYGNPDVDVDVEKIGRACGAFTAKLWLRERTVHDDLCFCNITQMPDGRIGIIDLASVRCADPESMFIIPLATQPCFARPMAETFEELSGVRLDLESVKGMHARWQLLLALQKQTDEVKALTEGGERNLEDFLRLNRSQFPQRPVSEKRSSFRFEL